MMRFRLPFVPRREFERSKLENMTLRDALRNANAELAKHRRLIADIRDGDGLAFDRIRKAGARGDDKQAGPAIKGAS